MNNERMQYVDDDDDRKYIEVNDKNISKQIIIATTNPDDFSSLPTYEEFQYYSNSHDLLIPLDHHMDTTTSSTDDLTKTNQFLLSDFYSKDSAVYLSDETFNRSNTLDNADEQEQIVPLTTLQDKSKQNLIFFFVPCLGFYRVDQRLYILLRRFRIKIEGEIIIDALSYM
jgi:hypothetical protein